MADRWDEPLRCSRCRNTGMPSLSQFKDAQMPTVELVTAGFKVVQTEYGPDFHCAVCKVAAAP
jgi:hypothetical protein